jgi:hypothetical protein
MKVQTSKYGNARPKIEQEDLEGGDAAVFTIAAVEEQKVTGDDGERLSLVLLTEELGDKVLWLNVTQIGYLIAKLGDESDRWVGQKVPLEKTITHYAGKPFKKVWVAAPESWDQIFEDAGVSEKKPRRRSVAVASKKKAKRGR